MSNANKQFSSHFSMPSSSQIDALLQDFRPLEKVMLVAYFQYS